ncbi:DUF3558 family protein [Corynebacterium phoceense]|uniref:DUF3558 family protein n=1 Tax=Corynebacterium phoceense TaxID=1686286 RepID=UPI0018ABCA33|nr:DUF3558 family protein [Corynebacterium phoceense]MBF9010813.1 DUF3558 family protein [Corynebacterium phoceense]
MLRPLHNVACLGIVAAFLAGCTVSDAEPQPAVGTAAVASPASPAPDTGDDDASEDQASIDLGGWSMPEPGPFDWREYYENPFKPCEELPEDVVAQLGFKKKAMNLTDVQPYTCDLVEQQEIKNDSGLLFITSYGASLSQLQEGRFELTDETVPRLSNARVMQQTGGDTQTTCFAAIETPRGTVAVNYVNSLGQGSGETFCDVPIRIFENLFEGSDAK